MPGDHSFATALILITALSPFGAYAGANVLLPSERARAKGGFPNLGIMVEKTTPLSPESKAEPQKPPEETNVPTEPPPKPKPPQPAPEPEPDDGTEKTLTVSFHKSSSLGSGDYMNIKGRLGVAPGLIASACQLWVKGSVKTTKGSYDFGQEPSKKNSVDYQGSIETFSGSLFALCHPDSVALEKKNSQKLKDYYIVSLTGLSCDPEIKGRPSEVIISYNQGAITSCESK